MRQSVRAFWSRTKTRSLRVGQKPILREERNWVKKAAAGQWSSPITTREVIGLHKNGISLLDCVRVLCEHVSDETALSRCGLDADEDVLHNALTVARLVPNTLRVSSGRRHSDYRGSLRDSNITATRVVTPCGFVQDLSRLQKLRQKR
jgi:hypothetical protein